MHQGSTTGYHMHPASKWLLEVVGDNDGDILMLRVAMLVAAWWINHDRDPPPELVDQVATELSGDRAAVRHIFTTLWPSLVRSKRGA